jgi:hypothetical protein
VSVEASLKKLKTSYIDILYLHWWDYETGIEDVMTNLHNLVASGKVLYLVCTPSRPARDRSPINSTSSRAFPIRLRGLSPNATSMLGITARPRFASIKDPGTS